MDNQSQNASTEYTKYTCASCGGSAHPASGCQYTETMVICGPCIRDAWRWVKGHTNTTKRVGAKVKGASRVSFYEAAGKFRPKDLP